MDFYAYQMNWYLAWNLESKQDTKLQPHLKWMRAALNVYKYVHFYSVSKINCVFFLSKANLHISSHCFSLSFWPTRKRKFWAHTFRKIHPHRFYIAKRKNRTINKQHWWSNIVYRLVTCQKVYGSIIPIPCVVLIVVYDNLSENNNKNTSICVGVCNKQSNIMLVRVVFAYEDAADFAW